MPIVHKVRIRGGERFHITGFGEYFAGLMESSSYKSQDEIAHVLGVSVKTLDNYLRNDRTPDVTMCELIAMTFGVSIAEVRAAAGKPVPTSIDAVFDKHIRSLMLGMDWTPGRLAQLTMVLETLEREQEEEWHSQQLSSTDTNEG